MKIIYHNLHGRNLQMEGQVGAKNVDMDDFFHGLNNKVNI
jgi:hypothetical protein